MVRAALMRRKARVVLALVALALGAALVTALLTVYGGVKHNLTREFRAYGPNLVITPGQNAAALSPAEIAQATAQLGPTDRAVGLLFARVQTQGRQAVLVGGDVPQLLALNPSWKVTGQQHPAVLLGSNAARQLHRVVGDSISAEYAGRIHNWTVGGIVTSGGSEDNQIFVPLRDAQQLTGLDGVTTLEIRAEGPAIHAVVERLRRSLPGADVDPIRQLTQSEGRIILSTRSMLIASILLILITIGLCVAAALASMALERRRDFGVMKALGAHDHQVFIAFVMEGLTLGVGAAVLGAAAGTALAAWFGHVLFRVALWPTAGTLLLALCSTAALAVIGAVAPWPLVRRISPATILKGE